MLLTNKQTNRQTNPCYWKQSSSWRYQNLDTIKLSFYKLTSSLSLITSEIVLYKCTFIFIFSSKVCINGSSVQSNRITEGVVAFCALPNPFLLNKICWNQIESSFHLLCSLCYLACSNWLQHRQALTLHGPDLFYRLVLMVSHGTCRSKHDAKIALDITQRMNTNAPSSFSHQILKLYSSG